MNVSVLLRDGNHMDATTRFALLVDRVAYTMGRTPILVPLPLNRPEIIDIGTVRPNMTISGIVATQGLNKPENSPTNYMETTDLTLYNTPTSSNHTSQTYYYPYKNVLEDFVFYTSFTSETPIEMEILGPKDPPSVDSSTRYHTIPTGEYHTGGAIYNVAIQNISFNLNASKEDRYDFSMALVATTRLDQNSSADMGFNYTRYKSGTQSQKPLIGRESGGMGGSGIAEA